MGLLDQKAWLGTESDRGTSILAMHSAPSSSEERQQGLASLGKGVRQEQSEF